MLFFRPAQFCEHGKIFESVVVSPVTVLPLAISFSNRRMIFPLRVFGSASAKRTSSGFAIAPICVRDVIAKQLLQLRRQFYLRP